MANLSIIQSYSVEIDGQTYTGGSGTAVTVSVAGETIFDRTYNITTSTATEVFRAGSAVTDDLADWVFMFLLSDVAGEVRVVTNVGNTAGTTTHGFVLQMAAGMPLMLTGGDASRQGSTDIDTFANNPFDDAADVIDAVDFFQSSGGASKLRIVAIR